MRVQFIKDFPFPVYIGRGSKNGPVKIHRREDELPPTAVRYQAIMEAAEVQHAYEVDTTGAAEVTGGLIAVILGV